MSTFPYLHDVLIRLARIESKLNAALRGETTLMTAADDIAQAIAVDTALLGDLTAVPAAIGAARDQLLLEIADLKDKGVDTSGLAAATAQLAAARCRGPAGCRRAGPG